MLDSVAAVDNIDCDGGVDIAQQEQAVIEAV
jgi:hypothetical protein